MKYTCTALYCPWRKDGLCLRVTCDRAVPIGAAGKDGDVVTVEKKRGKGSKRLES